MALAALCAAASIAVASVGDANGAGKTRGGCANASQPATEVSTRDLRKALHCVLNLARAEHGRSKLDRNGRLAKAARRHLEQMVRHDCLAHVCAGESELETRIRGTGYLHGASSYDYAEDVGCDESARGMVKRWMGSFLHRRNILMPRFEHLGISVSHARVPSRCDHGYVTFVVVFGQRAG